MKINYSFLIIALFFLCSIQGLKAQITSFPYVEQFNTTPVGWTFQTISGSPWAQGIPTITGSMGAYSAPGCVSTSLVNPYNYNTNSYIESPRFDISGLSNPLLTFAQYRSMATGLDGMHIEYSTDDVVWNRLNSTALSVNFNWYNSTSISATGLPAFTGPTYFGKWNNSGRYLNGLSPTGLIRFRFVFRSGFGVVQSGGIFVDDISILDVPATPVDAYLMEVIDSTQLNVISGKTAVHIKVMNNQGVNAIDSLTFGIVLNGNLVSNTKRAVNLNSFWMNYYLVDSVQIPQGPYTLDVFVAHPGDLNYCNDSISKAGIFNGVFSTPYFTDFESGAPGWLVMSENNTEWELGLPAYGNTTGAHSGVTAWDIDLDSSYGGMARTSLMSPGFSIDPSAIYRISFWQNRNLLGVSDGVQVEFSFTDGQYWNYLANVYDTCGWNWYSEHLSNGFFTTSFIGNSDGWINSQYRLSYLTGVPKVKFRFVFTSDSLGALDGFSLDDFKIEKIPAHDAAALSINNGFLHPVQGVNTGPVHLKFLNWGHANITSFVASYSVNGVVQQTAAVGATVIPCDTAEVILPGFVPPAGNFNICATIQLLGDTVASNNQICYTVSAIPAIQSPYSCDFESGAANWWAEEEITGTSWELGAPNYGATNSAHSGVNCWDVNLDTSYLEYADSYLYLPPLDLTTSGPAEMSFWMNYNNEENYDGVLMEYSVDGGLSWSILGGLNDTIGENWYNDEVGFSHAFPGWSGNSGGWVRAAYRMDAFAGVSQLYVRFRFISDQIVNKDGFSIDDFVVEEVQPYDAKLVSVFQKSIYPPIGVNAGVIELKVANAGTLPFTGFTYSYSVDGVTAQTASYNLPVAPFDTVTLQLPGHIPDSGLTDICAFISMASDMNHNNDTACFTERGLPLYTPYFQDEFDQQDKGWLSVTTGDQRTNWELGTPDYGATNTALSAPNCWDVNLDTSYFNSANTMLLSPWFDMSNVLDPKIKFWQNRELSNFLAEFQVEWRSYSDTTWHVLGNYQDPNGQNWYNHSFPTVYSGAVWTGSSNGWQLSTLKIPSLVGIGRVQFRMKFGTHEAVVPEDGVSIDNFKLEVQLANDVELTALQSPGTYSIQNHPYPVIVTMRNNSTVPITTATVKYSLNGGPLVSTPWTGNLAYDSLATVTLPAIYPLGGQNHLVVYVEHPGDLYAYNDTVSFTFNSEYVFPIPFNEDFESDDGNCSSANLIQFSRWEYGAPAFGATNSAHSGSLCWDINLTTPYGNAAYAYLKTPVFYLGANSIITLSFWQNYNTEINSDGMFVEYATDGLNWHPLGTISDPNGINWFNSVIYQGNQGWSGNSSGWINSSYVYNKVWGEDFLQLRFVFRSDLVLSGDGVSVDDISVTGVVGVPEVNSGRFSVYPNPASDVIHIDYHLSQQNDLVFSLQDMSGKRVMMEQLNSNVETMMVACNNLQTGLYCYTFTLEGVVVKSGKVSIIR